MNNPQRVVRVVDPELVAGAPSNAPHGSNLTGSVADVVREKMQPIVDSPIQPKAERVEIKPPPVPVDSAEFDTPDGHHVVMAPPNYPATLTISRALKDESPIYIGNAKAMCYIRAIDGIPIKLANQADFDSLMCRLGDQGLDMVALCYFECWPPVTQDSLGLIKKNLRGS